MSFFGILGHMLERGIRNITWRVLRTITHTHKATVTLAGLIVLTVLLYKWRLLVWACALHNRLCYVV